MSVFTIQVPDGRKIKIDAPNQATALRGAQEYVAHNPAQGAQPGASVAGAPQAGTQAAPPPQSMADQLSAGFTSGVNSLPIVGPSVLSGLENLKGMVQGRPQSDVAATDQAQVEDNPIPSAVGAVAGTALPFLIGGEIPGVAKVLGMDSAMPLAARVRAGVASNAAIMGTDAAFRGEDPLKGALLGGAAGAAGPLLEKGIAGIGSKIAAKATDMRQAAATDTAIKGAPSAADLKSQARSFFDTADHNAPAVTAGAYGRLMQGVKDATAKIRPNAANDPQAVGLLQHLTDLQQSAGRPGVVVDLKDLHLARQLAQKVGQSSAGRDALIGNTVVSQIDNFVKSLKPADILGAADPSTAAKALFKGISTWSRAVKVGAIEDAIKAADTYKSGPANGLKLSFLKLMRSPDFGRFTDVEKNAIRAVAKGSTGQNIAELFGKLGVSFSGGAAHNILGGGIGTAALSSVLAPVLGPLSVPAALGVTTATGMAGRAVAERMGTNAAERAVKVVATPNVPVVTPSPNILLPAARAAHVVTRSLPALSGR